MARSFAGRCQDGRRSADAFHIHWNASWCQARARHKFLLSQTLPDLDCSQISYQNFTVLWSVPSPDPHHFDADHDGVDCET